MKAAKKTGLMVNNSADKEAKAKDKQAYVSVNWSQAVLRVRFADGVGEEQVEMEEANEGEKE